MENTRSNRPEVRGKVTEIMEAKTFSSGFTKQEVMVETGYNFPNPIKVTFKKDATRFLEGVNVGDAVAIPYALDGRIWNSPDGTSRHFLEVTGLGLTKIAAAAGTGSASTPPKPASAKDAAIAAWKERNGDDMAALGAFCKAKFPGKPSKSYTDADWNAVKAAIEANDGGDGSADPDELPF